MPVKRQDVLPILEELTEKCQELKTKYEQAAHFVMDRSLKTRCIFLWQERARMEHELLDKVRWLGGIANEPSITNEEPPWEASFDLSLDEQNRMLEEGAEGDEEMVCEYDKALRYPLPIDVQMLLARHRMNLKANEKAGLLDHLVQNSLRRDILAQAVRN